RRTLPRVTVATLVIVTLLYAAVAVPEILVLGPTAGGTQAPVATMLKVAVGPAGAIVAAAIAVIISTGNSVAYVGSLAELSATSLPDTTQDAPRTLRAKSLAVPIVIVVGGLAAAALTPISTAELVSICAGSQVPVYLLGVGAGVKVFPRYSRTWWLSVLATTAVAVLLVPAGIYLLIPAGIAACVVARRRHQRRSP
ncbi:MAG: hypothetical protein ACRYG2_36330, partial [Janthinobacterium lividum]